MLYLFKGDQYLTKDIDFIVDLVTKMLKNMWGFYCWFSLEDIENFIVDLVSKILKILLLI